ncbi:Uncharacterized protein Rs2_28567 [Raphanus sativus]|uniref:Uncharacterized protein LOC108819003 n=1 Tax=Raphanus sativus TaxID=3726 RepID=A0A6J0KHW3_RAPSA|nr:uncharacterized protein LOC108819003 [Raphanus sativus]KAJ4888819.1 Uncharacterized protein Rs2_28567 [Raphanus sativus]
MHGNGAPQNRERDAKEYYCKGKGKVGEETDAQWVRVADRSNRRPSGYKGNTRGNGEEVKQRPSRRDDAGVIDQGGKKKESPRKQLWVQDDAQEEGEIRTAGEDQQMAVSQGFQEQLIQTQANGNEVISDPKGTEQGLKQLQGLVEGQLKIREDEVMEWDDLEAADNFPDLTEAEMAAMTLELEEHAALEDTEVTLVNEDAKGQKTEEEP